jgi:hypothetical protein
MLCLAIWRVQWLSWQTCIVNFVFSQIGPTRKLMPEDFWDRGLVDSVCNCILEFFLKKLNFFYFFILN